MKFTSTVAQAMMGVVCGLGSVSAWAEGGGVH
ncbi:MAG: hypothetical protein RLZZ494_1024, partial [Pseudomonadota bacterium]